MTKRCPRIVNQADKTEQDRYEASLKIYRNLTNVVDTAYDDGVAAMQNERDEAIRLVTEEKIRAEKSDKRAEEEKARANALFAESQKLKSND